MLLVEMMAGGGWWLQQPALGGLVPDIGKIERRYANGMPAPAFARDWRDIEARHQRMACRNRVLVTRR